MNLELIKGVIKNISLVPSEIEKKKIYIVEILLPKGLITSYNNGIAIFIGNGRKSRNNNG